MTIKILSGVYAHGYTLSAGYAGVSITSTGAVSSRTGAPAAYYSGRGFAAGAALTLPGGGGVANDGRIRGGAGGAGGDASIFASGVAGGRGGAGGVGVLLAAVGSVANHATIQGGRGGVGGAGSPGYYGYGWVSRGGLGGAGGVGVRLKAGGSLTNFGDIAGGAGGNGGLPGNAYTWYGLGGYGGHGVVLAQGGSVANFATITGGAGGLGGKYAQLPGGPGRPAPGGIGVSITAGGSVTNGSASVGTALIKGYDGIFLGGAGVVTNFGTIVGSGLASVYFSSPADRLVAEPGSKLVGVALGARGTLEIVGGAGVFTGLGSTGKLTGAVTATVRGFADYEIDHPASWTLAGSSTLVAGKTLKVDGQLTSTGAITNGGLIEAAGGGAAIFKSTVRNTGALVASHGDLMVLGAVTGGGVASIAGATLRLGSTFSENVTFTGAAPNGALDLARSQSYGGTIAGFSRTGATRLDLRDVAFVGPGQATFSGTSIGGVLTVGDGLHVAHIRLTGNYLSTAFIAASDGHGGVSITGATPPSHAFTAAMAGFAPSAAGTAPPAAQPWRQAAPALLAAAPHPT